MLSFGNINSLISKSHFNSIVIGLTFHSIGNLCSSIIDSQPLMALFCLTGWYYMLKGFFFFYSRRLLKCQLTGIAKLLYILYVIAIIIMIVRGYINLNRTQWISTLGMINFHLCSQYYILPYAMTIIAFIPFRYYNLNLICKIGTIFAVANIILSVIFFPKILASATMLSMGFDGEYGFGAQIANIYLPFAFITLCRPYIKKKSWIIHITSLVASLLVLTVAARRGSALIVAILLTVNLYNYIKYNRINKLFITILASAIVIGAIYMFNTSSMFSFMHERGLEDTRSGVDKALLSQMTSEELLIGKGLNGCYYYPLSDDDYLDGWRFGSETGFYNIVLKGGYVMAYIYITLLLFSAIKGIFKSKNVLCKVAGIYIFISLLELYPFGWLMFNMKFLIIWMFVVLLQMKSVRRMNDYQIYSYLFK